MLRGLAFFAFQEPNLEIPIIETPAAPAAAPTPAPTTVSASLDAVTKGDYSAFHESEAAARRGTPKPSVEATIETPAAPVTEPPSTPAAPPTEARAISKRQQDLNDRIREAVTRATAEKDAEIARLRGAQPQPQPAAEPAPREPAWKRIAAMPDAPKLADFDSVEDHAAAMALFVDEVRHAERTTEAQTRTAREQHDADETARISAFDARVTALAEHDPEIVSVIAPVAEALGKAGGPYGIISSLALDSPVGPQLLRQFKEHPEELHALATMPESLRGLPPQVAIARHIQLIVKGVGKLETKFDTVEEPAPVAAPAASPISAALPPLPTISRAGSSVDPKAAALAKGDFAAFSQLERADRAAKRRSA